MLTDQYALLPRPCVGELLHILQHHVQVVVEAFETAIELFFTLHEDPEDSADALVDHFKG